MQLQSVPSKSSLALAGLLLVALAAQSVFAVITVQIGGATRLNSLSRQRDRYSCYWDCDLVGCQIARDDDECAYDCEKICRVRYDYTGRSGALNAGAAESELKPKSAGEPAKPAEQPASGDNSEILPELVGGKYHHYNQQQRRRHRRSRTPFRRAYL